MTSEPLDPARLAPLFFTGTSPFLVANENLVRAMIRASAHAPLHASENIHDANGMLLWATGRPVDEHLLERLAERRLRKPVELCVYASDGNARLWLRDRVLSAIDHNPSLAAIAAPQMREITRVLEGLVPTPSELMLLTVLRHGGEDRIRHAAVVAALSLSLAVGQGLHEDLLRPLARAAFLHDVGLLYLQHEDGSCTPEQYRRHALFGARVAVELAHASGAVSRMIASSHERLDGWGYPRRATADDLSPPERLLLFAEAIAPSIESGPDGLRRAAVMARLVPGEFDAGLVDAIGHLSPHGPLQDVIGTLTWPVTLGLKQVHSVLETLPPLLASPRAESRAVREAAQDWALRVKALRQVLDTTGVAEELGRDGEIESDDLQENFELVVVCEELLARVRDLRSQVEEQRAQSPELDSSPLVIDVLDALELAATNPPGVAPGRHGVLHWSRIFSVGIAEVDEQHKTLIHLLNRLHEATLRPGASFESVRAEVLGRLVDYVAVHFATEEALMAKYGVAEAPLHIAEHGALREEVGRLCADPAAPADARALEDLALFLRTWLVAHVLHTDKAMGRALRAAGAR